MIVKGRIFDLVKISNTRKYFVSPYYYYYYYGNNFQIRVGNVIRENKILIQKLLYENSI